MTRPAADTWIRGLLIAYVFLLPLRRLYFLPGLGSRFQLTEVAFLLLAPVLGYRLLQLRRWPGVSLLLTGFAAYLLILTASTLLSSPDVHQLVELLGRFYLFSLLVGVLTYLRQWSGGVSQLLNAWSWGTFLMGTSAYLGYGLALSGHLTPLVSVYENFPYFGTLYRAVGVSGGATAFVLLSIIPCAISWLRWRTLGKKPYLLLFLLPPLFLTFSKEIILLLLALGIVDPAIRSKKWVLYLSLVAGTALYWFSTHYIVQAVQDIEGSVIAQEEYTSGRVVWRGEQLQLLETSYVSLKRAALLVGLRHPWIGVGADGFPEELPRMKEEGSYPPHLPDYIPHSTLFGAFAEGGFLGIAALLLIAGGLLQRVRRLLPWIDDSDERWCLIAFFVVLAIGSPNMDLLHLRFFWVAAALLFAGGLPETRPVHAP